MSFSLVGNCFLCDNFGGIESYYEFNECGYLTPTLQANEEVQWPSELPLPEKTEWVSHLAQYHVEYRKGLVAICETIGYNISIEKEDGPDLFEFSLELKEGFKNITSLDLSNKGLTTLPPQIRLCKNLETLDISENDFCLLPPELQLLPLREINISQNPRLQPNLPSWLSNLNNFKLIAYGIELRFLPRGLRASQVVCEKKFSDLGSSWGR